MVENHESVQFALFLAHPSNLTALELWNVIFDEPVAGFQKLSEQQSQANGKIEDAAYTLSVQPARTDLIIQGAPGTPATQFPPKISDLDGTISKAIVAFSRCLSRLSVGRAAAVLQGTNHASSREDANAKVRLLVPGLPGSSFAKEITYQLVVDHKSENFSPRNIVQIFRCQSVQIQTIEIKPNQAIATTTSAYAAHLYADVSGENMETLDEAGAHGALTEVVERARAIYTGGIDALA